MSLSCNAYSCLEFPIELKTSNIWDAKMKLIIVDLSNKSSSQLKSKPDFDNFRNLN